MVKIDFNSYSDYIRYAEDCRCGKVYPLSVAEGCQRGDIYVNSEIDCKAVFFRHYSGFAFISGKYDESFLESVYNIISDAEKRTVLFTEDECIKNFFSLKKNVSVERRYFFEYKSKRQGEAADLPLKYELKVIDSELLSEIKGRITPFFSWDNAEDFLTKGRGYCIVIDGEAAAWAFSAAVSNSEIDIGVETKEKYRHKGFAEIVSKAMIRYILAQNKAPVWACHCKNIASAKLAEKSGFVKAAECFVIKINEILTYHSS